MASPAEALVLLAGGDPGRAPRPLRQRGATGRARRALQRPAVRGAHLRAAARQPPHRRAAQRPGQEGGARVHRQVPRRQRRRGGDPHSGCDRGVAGVHQRPAAAARRRSTGSSAEAALAHARAARRVQPRNPLLQPRRSGDGQTGRGDRRCSIRTTPSAATSPAAPSTRCATSPSSWARSAAAARRS